MHARFSSGVAKDALVMSIAQRHEWTVSTTARYLRTYCSLWAADPEHTGQSEDEKEK